MIEVQGITTGFTIKSSGFTVVWHRVAVEADGQTRGGNTTNKVELLKK